MVDGLRQILWGLFKKMVIADRCAEFVNPIFAHSANDSGATLALGALLFAFQIYCDFSGYSDIALGAARLLGIDLLRNFNYPYFSRDIAEFWRRWHISLSTWFRDYLYIPLGGSKGSKWKIIRNTWIIFLVSGFWHGANWTFIAWGALNALFIMPLVIFKKNRVHLETVAQGKLFPTLREAVQIAATFAMTTLAWIVFRADSITQAMHYVKQIFSRSLFTIPQVHAEKLGLLIGIFIILEWLGRDQPYAIARLGVGESSLGQVGHLLCAGMYHLPVFRSGTAIHLFPILVMRKKFIRSLLIFLAPIVVIAFVGDLLLRHIPNDYSYKNEYLNKHSNSVAVLLLGSSHAFYGLNPRYFTARTFNAAYDSQSLDYDDAILEKYSWNSQRYVLIPISYFSIYSKLTTGIEAWRVKDYVIYYKIPPPRELTDYTEIFSGKLDVNCKRIYSYYLSGVSPVTCTDQGWGTTLSSRYNRDLTETALEAVKRHTVARDEEVVDANEAALQRMIRYAQQHHIVLVLYTPPAYPTYTDRLDPAQWAATRKIATEAAATYPHTYYLDFLRDTSFTARDFHDADHLNEIGAEKFSRMMDGELHRLSGFDTVLSDVRRPGRGEPGINN